MLSSQSDDANRALMSARGRPSRLIQQEQGVVGGFVSPHSSHVVGGQLQVSM
jgi:hypothetical protein